MTGEKAVMATQANQPSVNVLLAQRSPREDAAYFASIWSLSDFQMKKLEEALAQQRTWALADRQAREEARDGGGWRVKPLEWEHHPHAHSEVRAASPMGRYRITNAGMRVMWRSDAFGRNTWRMADTTDEAKAAAQDDYEARIRSAIEPSPVEGDRR